MSPVQVNEDGANELHYKNCRAACRVPIGDIPDLEAYLWTESRRIPVQIKDAGPSEALLDISAIGRAILYGEGLLLLEVSRRTVHFLISGTVRQADGAMAQSLLNSPVIFARDATAALQWNEMVDWLQIEWLLELRRLQEEAYQSEAHPDFVQHETEEPLDY